MTDKDIKAIEDLLAVVENMTAREATAQLLQAWFSHLLTYRDHVGTEIVQDIASDLCYQWSETLAMANYLTPNDDHHQ